MSFVLYEFLYPCSYSVGIVTRHWPGRPRNQGLIPGRDKRLFFSFSNCRDGLWSRIQRLPAAGSPPSSAEVKNTWGCAFTHPYVFIRWCLVKHRNNSEFFSSEQNLKSVVVPSKLRVQLYVTWSGLYPDYMNLEEVHSKNVQCETADGIVCLHI
jgi:hypothetical protein